MYKYYLFLNKQFFMVIALFWECYLHKIYYQGENKIGQKGLMMSIIVHMMPKFVIAHKRKAFKVF